MEALFAIIGFVLWLRGGFSTALIFAFIGYNLGHALREVKRETAQTRPRGSTGPSYGPHRQGRDAGRAYVFCTTAAAMLAKMAKDEVEDGNSVFIAISFTDARLRIQMELEKAGVPFGAIYGGQKESERNGMIDAFQQNRTHVVIGMMQACGVALSLHDTKHERPRVSLISPSFSASDVVQALGRIRRVGGTAATQKFVLVADSVEERVARSIRAKLEAMSSLTDQDLLASVKGSMI